MNNWTQKFHKVSDKVRLQIASVGAILIFWLCFSALILPMQKDINLKQNLLEKLELELNNRNKMNQALKKPDDQKYQFVSEVNMTTIFENLQTAFPIIYWEKLDFLRTLLKSSVDKDLSEYNLYLVVSLPKATDLNSFVQALEMSPYFKTEYFEVEKKQDNEILHIHCKWLNIDSQKSKDVADGTQN